MKNIIGLLTLIAMFYFMMKHGIEDRGYLKRNFDLPESVKKMARYRMIILILVVLFFAIIIFMK